MVTVSGSTSMEGGFSVGSFIILEVEASVDGYYKTRVWTDFRKG